MLVSLIVATYGRQNELTKLLESLKNQTYKNFEVLIIDQNDKISIDSIVFRYTSKLNIKHIKTSRKGIAHSKNLGIKHSVGELITFPDDDCKYYPDTLQNAYDFYNKNPSIDIFYGRVYDIEHNLNIIRNWYVEPMRLNKYNFYLNYSAITCFTKRKELLFDENFGIGSNYAMGEELDYIMNALNLKYTVFYTPSISIWHPQLNVSVMSKEKVFNYAFGYGATIKKNFNLTFGVFFISSLLYQILHVVIHFFTANDLMMSKRYLALKGRIMGFLHYKKSYR